MADDTVFLEGIEFQAWHGASDEEQSVGHRYRVDLSLQLDTRAAAADDNLDLTVNYSKVAKLVLDWSTSHQYRLIETLAERLCEQILDRWALVESVTLTVRKLHPPMRVAADASGVRITRVRVMP